MTSDIDSSSGETCLFSNRYRASFNFGIGLSPFLISSGSKVFVYFTLKEETTGVMVVENFKSATLSDDDQLRQEVLSMVENSFNEENAYLKKCLRHVIFKGQEEQEKIFI